jgi:ribosomal protein S12 methylthiotransferase accessory factor
MQQLAPAYDFDPTPECVHALERIKMRSAPDFRRLSGVLDTLVDKRVGIIELLELVPRDPGDPDFFGFAARACDTSAFQSEKNFGNTGGVSSNRETAAAKAIGEAVERYCSAQYDSEQMPLVSFESAPFVCVAPGDFALFGADQYAEPGFPWVPFEASTPVHWMPANDPLTGDTIHVPAAMVFVPYIYYLGTGDSPIVQPISTGLSCHCSVYEAALNSVCEVIERDAVTITWQARMSHPQIRIESLSQSNQDLVTRFERVGLSVTLLNITLDTGVPTCLAVLRGLRPEQTALVVAGSAELNPERAVRKALEELEHTRRYSQQIKTAVPPLEPESDFSNVTDQMSHLHYWSDHAHVAASDFLTASAERVDFRDLPHPETGDPREDLQTVCKLIRKTGHCVLLADVTTPDVRELGLAVVRAVIPGYHPLYMGYRLRSTGGTRLWDIPQQLGHRGVRREEGDYPFPHPYP